MPLAWFLLIDKRVGAPAWDAWPWVVLLIAALVVWHLRTPVDVRYRTCTDQTPTLEASWSGPGCLRWSARVYRRCPRRDGFCDVVRR